MLLRSGLDVFTFTLCRMDTLAVGSLLAVVFTSPSHWRTVVQWTRRLVLPIGGVAFGSFFILSGTGHPALQAVKYTLFAGLCAAVLVLALSPGKFNPAPRVFDNPLLRSMGKTSYAMYVFHPFIFGQVLGRLYQSNWSPLQGRLWPSIIGEFMVAVGLTILVSRVSWIFFEQPILRLKNRFCYESPQAVVERTKAISCCLPSPATPLTN